MEQGHILGLQTDDSVRIVSTSTNLPGAPRVFLRLELRIQNMLEYTCSWKKSKEK